MRRYYMFFTTVLFFWLVAMIALVVNRSRLIERFDTGSFGGDSSGKNSEEKSAQSNSVGGSVGVGMYDYLAPVPAGNKWRVSVTEKFIEKYNSVLTREGRNYNKLDPKRVDDFALTVEGSVFVKNTLEKEAEYYISKGSFPISSYVTDFMKKNPDIFIAQQFNSNQRLDYKNVAFLYSNRMIYGAFIGPIDASKDPKPQALEIFLGKAAPPSAMGKNKVEASSSQTSLSSAEVDKLRSVCASLPRKPTS